jgi:hypothetical protein
MNDVGFAVKDTQIKKKDGQNPDNKNTEKNKFV